MYYLQCVHLFMLKSSSSGAWYAQKRLITNITTQTTVTLLLLCESFSQSEYPTNTLRWGFDGKQVSGTFIGVLMYTFSHLQYVYSLQHHVKYSIE